VVAAWGVGLVVGPALGGYLAQVIVIFECFGMQRVKHCYMIIESMKS